MAIIFLRDRVGFALLTLHKIKVLFVRIDPSHTIVVGRARIAEATNRSYENDNKSLRKLGRLRCVLQNDQFTF